MIRRSFLIDSLFRLADAIAPPGERQWIAAVRAETPEIRGRGEQFQWALGSVAAAVRIRASTEKLPLWFGTCAALALITVMDWQREDAGLTVAVLAASACALGYLYPGRQAVIGKLCGLWLLIPHCAADVFVALRPCYQRVPLNGYDLLEIGGVVLLTVPSAWIGARLSHRRSVPLEQSRR